MGVHCHILGPMRERWTPALVGPSLVAALAAACGGGGGSSPTGPGPNAPPLSVVQESDTVVFHLSPGDRVDVERNEAFDAWIEEQLGLGLPGKLQYYKYLSPDHMFALTGQSANGRAEPAALEVHSVFPFHSHETVHVYTHRSGFPPHFFNEGIAVALGVDPLAGDFTPTYAGGVSVHDWARSQGAALRPIESIATTTAFRAIPEIEGYPQAGSFMAFLVDEHGPRTVMEFFSTSTPDDSLDRIRSNFAAVFGTSLAAAEQSWHTFLGLP